MSVFDGICPVCGKADRLTMHPEEVFCHRCAITVRLTSTQINANVLPFWELDELAHNEAAAFPDDYDPSGAIGDWEDDAEAYYQRTRF